MADFFESSDVQDIVQGHISQVLKLEDDEAKRVLRSYKRVRQELRDRLDLLPRGSFTAQRMAGTLAQIDAAIAQMSQNLLQDMSPAVQQSAEMGYDHLISEIQDFEQQFTGAVIPVNLDVVIAATETRNFLFNRYESSIQNYSSFVRARMARALSDAVIAQDSTGDVVSDLGKVLQGEEWKLQQIVRTELHNVYNIGKIRGMGELWGEGEGDIPDLKKTLFQPLDSRTGDDSKYTLKIDMVKPINEPFAYTWNGKKRIFMAPPDRPNDRQILIPYREAWSKSR
jgi:hypothetical protein